VSFAGSAIVHTLSGDLPISTLATRREPFYGFTWDGKQITVGKGRVAPVGARTATRVVLANGKTSRLYRRLVFDQQIATDVSAAQNSREIAGFMQIAATAAPGHALPEIEAAITEEVDNLATNGPTADEMERGRVQAESQFMFRLQSVGGFGGKSDQLNAYNTFVGDPAYFERDLARYQRVTPASMQSAMARSLARGVPRVMLSVVPRGRPALAMPGSVVADVS